MKKFMYYSFIMTVIIILLPLFIVKSCCIEQESHLIQPVPDKNPDKNTVKDPVKAQIKVYDSSEKKLKNMELEEYIKGVVAAEMPAEFELEALKAQAVAARTYAYARMKKNYEGKEEVHMGADICTNPAHCQAWISREEAVEKWGKLKGEYYWSKIEKAVNETADIIITYDNSIANPVFHSNSGGKTENAEEVWEGGPVPYLISVPSNGEDACSEYKSVEYIKIEDFKSILQKEYPDIKFTGSKITDDIKIEDYTAGSRVKNIKVGNIEIKGTDIRRLFSLKSTIFDIELYDDKTLKITTIGNGHGVGMSQWGANYLAQNGKGYQEILKYYYSGISLETIEDFENK